jgi:hypothetical protein
LDVAVGLDRSVYGRRYRTRQCFWEVIDGDQRQLVAPKMVASRHALRRDGDDRLLVECLAPQLCVAALDERGVQLRDRKQLADDTELDRLPLREIVLHMHLLYTIDYFHLRFLNES